MIHTGRSKINAENIKTKQVYLPNMRKNVPTPKESEESNIDV